LGIRETVNGKRELQQNISLSRPYIAFFMIWGIQGLLSAVVEFLGQWLNIGQWGLLIIGIAIIISILILWRNTQTKLVRRPKASRVTGIKTVMAPLLASKAVVPLLLTTGALWALGYTQMINPLSTPLLKSFILAIAYTRLSVWLGKPFFYMGIWLYILTLAVALEYLGLASIVLGGFGGISMIALGWMLYIGNTCIDNKRIRGEHE
jgi:hypothetical protein